MLYSFREGVLQRDFFYFLLVSTTFVATYTYYSCQLQNDSIVLMAFLLLFHSWLQDCQLPLLIASTIIRVIFADTFHRHPYSGTTWEDLFARLTRHSFPSPATPLKFILSEDDFYLVNSKFKTYIF